jgi:hypothetical protein
MLHSIQHLRTIIIKLDFSIYLRLNLSTQIASYYLGNLKYLVIALGYFIGVFVLLVDLYLHLFWSRAYWTSHILEDSLL